MASVTIADRIISKHNKVNGFKPLLEKSGGGLHILFIESSPLEPSTNNGRDFIASRKARSDRENGVVFLKMK